MPSRSQNCIINVKFSFEALIDISQFCRNVVLPPLTAEGQETLLGNGDWEMIVASLSMVSTLCCHALKPTELGGLILLRIPVLNTAAKVSGPLICGNCRHLAKTTFKMLLPGLTVSSLYRPVLNNCCNMCV